MTSSERHDEGWTNEETLAITRWIESDFMMWCYWKAVASQCKENAQFHKNVQLGLWTVDEAPRKALSVWMRRDSYGLLKGSKTSRWSELALAGYDEIDWGQAADHLLALNPFRHDDALAGEPDVEIDPLVGDQYVPDPYGPAEE